MITNLVLIVTIFFSPLSPRVFFLFYTLFLFHLHPPRVDQIIGVDPCPINTFLKSLGVAVRLKIIVQVSFLINAARKLATEHSMR